MFKKIISGVLSLAMCSSLVVSLNTSKEENITKNSQNESDYKLSGSNSLGNYLTQLSNQNKQEAPEKSDTSVFSVTSLEFDAETKEVHVCSTQTKNCNITVTIAEESTGETVFSAVLPVKSGELVVTDEKLDIPSLPEYFIVKAFLSNEIGGKISNEYISTKYTKDTQDILNADIYDFNEEQVVNFDESEDTNFIVLNEDTVISESTEDENVLVTADYDSNVFTFENADENVRSMEFGQYFYIQPNDTDIIAVAVDSVETNGDITTVKGSDESIDDMFDFIKIEQDELGSTMTVDTTNAYECLTYIGHEDEDTFETDGGIEFEVVKKRYNAEFSVSKTITIAATPDKIKKLTGSEKLSNMLTGSIEIYSNLHFYKHKDHMEYEVKVVPRIKFDLKYTTPDPLTEKETVQFDELGQYVEEKETPATISFGHYQVPTNIPGIAIGFDPRIEISLSATIDCSISIKHTFGTKYNSDYTFNPGSEDPNSESLNDIEESPICKAAILEGSLSIRLILDPKVVLIKKELANICLQFSAGVDFTLGNRDSAGNVVNCIRWIKYPSNDDKTVYAYQSDSDSEHGCDFCIIGKIDFVAEVSIYAEVLGKKVFSFTSPKFTMPILETYYSNRTGFHVGKTLLDGNKAAMCDNKRYKANFMVTDIATASYVQNAKIDIDGLQVSTNKNGSAYVFCDNGSYPYTVSINSDRITSGKITINNAAATINIEVKSQKDENGTVTYSIANSSSSKGTTQTTTAYTTTTRTTTSTTAPSYPEYSIIKAGSLSDNIGYSVYNNGYMHIYGYGEMDDTLTVKALDGVRDKVTEVYFEALVPYSSDPDTGDDNTSIVPESDIKITNIGSGLFNGCVNLKTIEIPSTITSIGGSAFKKCKSVPFGDLILPEGLKSIGSFAFQECHGLTALVIPDTVELIDVGIVNKCLNFEKVTLPFAGKTKDAEQGTLLQVLFYENNRWIGDRDGGLIASEYEGMFDSCAYDRNGFDTFYSGCVAAIPKKFNSIVITGGDHIPKDAFSECSFLKEIVLPEGIKTIGKLAFYNCTSITDLTLPESVTEIGDSAFRNCFSLTNINIPDNVKSIERMAFCNCDSINSIFIPSNVEQLGYNCFFSCDKLQYVVISEGVKEIDSSIFEGCDALEKVYIYGEKGSAAEKFATENNYIFIDINSDESNDVPITTSKVTTTTFKRTITETTTTTTTTTTTEEPVDYVFGDANCDDGVDMADAVLIMQFIANPNKYGPNGSDKTHITKEGMEYGDVFNKGDGISLKDALAIQKFLLVLIDSLPESYAE